MGSTVISFRVDSRLANRFEKQLKKAGKTPGQALGAIAALIADQGLSAVTGSEAAPMVTLEAVEVGAVYQGSTGLIGQLMPGNYINGQLPTGRRVKYVCSNGFLWQLCPKKDEVEAIAPMGPELFQEVYSADRSGKGVIGRTMPRIREALAGTNDKNQLRKLLALVSSADANDNWLWFENEYAKLTATPAPVAPVEPPAPVEPERPLEAPTSRWATDDKGNVIEGKIEGSKDHIDPYEVLKEYPEEVYTTFLRIHRPGRDVKQNINRALSMHGLGG
jgi:hypothetical protein